MRNGAKITKINGQSSARWQVLGRAAHGNFTVSDMARQLGLARQSVQRVANDLKQDGLVIFVTTKEDRRTYIVEITEKGSKILRSIYERNNLWSEAMRRRISSEEFNQVIELLKKIGTEIEKELIDE